MEGNPQRSNYIKLSIPFRYSEYQSAFVCHFVFYTIVYETSMTRGIVGVRLMSCSLKWGMTVGKRLPFYVIRILSQFKTRNITQLRVSRPFPPFVTDIFFALILNIKLRRRTIRQLPSCLARFLSKQYKPTKILN